jgi:hypothetical protein
VPAALGELTALTALKLNANYLTSVPASLGRLTSLEELNLSRNQLTSVPKEFGKLTALRELHLQENVLKRMPAEWKGGGALEKSGCAIKRQVHSAAVTGGDPVIERGARQKPGASSYTQTRLSFSPSVDCRRGADVL